MMFTNDKYRLVRQKMLELCGGLEFSQIPSVGLLLVFCNYYEQWWSHRPHQSWLEDLSFVDLADVLQELNKESQ